MNSMDAQGNMNQTHTKRNLSIYDLMTTWMEHDGIMLSETSERERKTTVISFICGI